MQLCGGLLGQQVNLIVSLVSREMRDEPIMSTLSFHAGEPTEQAVRTLAAQQGVSVSTMVGQLVEEGLLMRRFPGLVFRDGPTGRRAAIAASLDVWEIVALLQDFHDDESALLAAYPLLTPTALKTARTYYAERAAEIDARISRSRQSEAEVILQFPTLFTVVPQQARKRSSLSRKRPSRRVVHSHSR
jgi:hypothetical protein